MRLFVCTTCNQFCMFSHFYSITSLRWFVYTTIPGPYITFSIWGSNVISWSREHGRPAVFHFVCWFVNGIGGGQSRYRLYHKGQPCFPISYERIVVYILHIGRSPFYWKICSCGGLTWHSVMYLHHHYLSESLLLSHTLHEILIELCWCSQK